MAEDLHVAPLYVINCGLTCQGRNAEFFEGEELQEFIQDACNAIDYATADPSENEWAAKRAAAGHPEPFPLKYVEIGNENDHEPYFERYPMFYDVLKERYPQLKFIANTHVERQGLPAEIVDEHYYNSAEYFAKNIDFYTNYDRSDPKVFVGEYAVTCGTDIANLRAALAESAFLIGIENNQDIVALTSYAPLFSNVNYKSWHPDLIEFDNHSSYGIPSYYAVSMLGAKRGKYVVTVDKDLPMMTDKREGRAGFVADSYGVQFRNLRVNGESLEVTHTMAGKVNIEDGIIETVPGEKNYMENFPGFAHSLKGITFSMLGEDDLTQFVYEGEVKINSPEERVGLTIWNYHSPMLSKIDETMEDMPEYAPDAVDYCDWSFKGGIASVNSTRWFFDQPLGEEVKVDIPYGEFFKFKIVSQPDGFDCYMNDHLIQKARFTPFVTTAVSALDDEESVIVKIVNFNDVPADIRICLDCPVESKYQVELLESKSYKDTNTLEEPEKVIPKTVEMFGASSNFIYKLPAYSLNILTLKKKQTKEK